MGICINRYGLACYVGQLLVDLRWGFLHIRCPGLGIVQWIAGHGWNVNGPEVIGGDKHTLGQWE